MEGGRLIGGRLIEVALYTKQSNVVEVILNVLPRH